MLWMTTAICLVSIIISYKDNNQRKKKKKENIFSLQWELSIYSLNNFIYTAVLTIVIMLTISLVLTYLVTRSLYLLTIYSHSSSHNPSTLVTTHNVIPFSITHAHTQILLDSTYMWDHTVSVWLISLSTMPSRSTMLLQTARFPHFYGWIIFHCVYMCTCVYYNMIYIQQLFYPFLLWWTLRLFSYLGSCK